MDEHSHEETDGIAQHAVYERRRPAVEDAAIAERLDEHDEAFADGDGRSGRLVATFIATEATKTLFRRSPSKRSTPASMTMVAARARIRAMGDG